MGSVYAGLLADAGNDVWAIDIDATHIAAIADKGLRVEGASGDRVVPLRATTDCEDVGIAELVVIATKVMNVRAAAEAAVSLVGHDTVVLAIQNGLGGPELASEILGDAVAAGSVGGFGASLVAPGHVHHHGMEFLALGELKGAVTPRVERVAAVLRHARFKIATDDNIQTRIWEKLICNACFSGPSVVLDLTIGEILEQPDAWAVAAACAEEALAAAQAKGIPLTVRDASEYARAFGHTIPNAVPSMLIDVRAGKPSEVDYINGAVARVGDEFGVAARVNRTITSLVKAREATSSVATPA
jgi:2-dehydropantoate 2-reductase